MSKNFSSYEDLSSLFTTIGNKLRGKPTAVELTQAQYDALTPAQKSDTSKQYFITDASNKIYYNNVVYDGGGVWGNITGDISDQEDLQEILDGEIDLLQDTVGWTGKNLNSYPYQSPSKVEHGITFTDNGDGTVLVNGTAETGYDVQFFCHTRNTSATRKLVLPNGRYIITGCPEGGNDSNKYAIRVERTYNGSVNRIATDIGNGATFVLNGDDNSNKEVTVQLQIIIKSGTVCNNLLFKPMIRLASINDATYEPYHSSVKQTLRDAEVIEGKNLIPYPYEKISVTHRGITFTANDDGTIGYAGTASTASTAYAVFKSSVLLKAGSYKLTGGNSQTGGLVVNFFDDKNKTNYTGTYIGLGKTGAGAVYLNTTQNGGEYNLNNVYGYEKPFTINSDAYVDIYARSVSNAYTSAVSGTIYPMLRYATEEDATYEPYYIPLKDSKFDRSEQGILGAKNLIPYPFYNTTRTQNDITWTDNGDGTFTVNGTASANSFLYILSNVPDGELPFPNNTAMTASVEVSGNQAVGMYLYSNGRDIFNANGASTPSVTFTSPAVWEKTSSRATEMALYVSKNSVINNAIIKPMLRLASDADDTYQSYAETNYQLTHNKLSYKDNRVLGAKNLLPYPYTNTTKTQSGITFTDNGDGSVLVNGTATEEVAFEFNSGYAQIPIEDGEYIVSGCPSGGSSSTYMYQYTLRNISAGTTSWLGEFGNGAKFTETSNIKYGYSRILIKSGTVCDNLLFKPMIRLASDPDDTWQPYAMTNKELTGKVDTLAPLASPALTGTPTAPTATAGTNTTQIATTAFVQTAIDTAITQVLSASY